jgi:hypothetical protein
MVTITKNGWVPVSSGEFPDEGESVQVTYLSYHNNAPMCDCFAFISGGVWYWTNSYEQVNVIITAWKRNCEPYTGE